MDRRTTAIGVTVGRTSQVSTPAPTLPPHPEFFVSPRPPVGRLARSRPAPLLVSSSSFATFLPLGQPSPRALYQKNHALSPSSPPANVTSSNLSDIALAAAGPPITSDRSAEPQTLDAAQHAQYAQVASQHDGGPLVPPPSQPTVSQVEAAATAFAALPSHPPIQLHHLPRRPLPRRATNPEGVPQLVGTHHPPSADVDPTFASSILGALSSASVDPSALLPSFTAAPATSSADALTSVPRSPVYDHAPFGLPDARQQPSALHSSAHEFAASLASTVTDANGLPLPDAFTPATVSAGMSASMAEIMAADAPANAAVPVAPGVIGAGSGDVAANVTSGPGVVVVEQSRPDVEMSMPPSGQTMTLEDGLSMGAVVPSVLAPLVSSQPQQLASAPALSNGPAATAPAALLHGPCQGQPGSETRERGNSSAAAGEGQSDGQDWMGQIGQLLDDILQLASHANADFSRGDHAGSAGHLGHLQRKLALIGELGFRGASSEAAAAAAAAAVAAAAATNVDAMRVGQAMGAPLDGGTASMLGDKKRGSPVQDRDQANKLAKLEADGIEITPPTPPPLHHTQSAPVVPQLHSQPPSAVPQPSLLMSALTNTSRSAQASPSLPVTGVAVSQHLPLVPSPLAIQSTPTSPTGTIASLMAQPPLTSAPSRPRSNTSGSAFAPSSTFTLTSPVKVDTAAPSALPSAESSPSSQAFSQNLSSWAGQPSSEGTTDEASSSRGGTDGDSGRKRRRSSLNAVVPEAGLHFSPNGSPGPFAGVPLPGGSASSGQPAPPAIEPELKARLDAVFLQFLNRICSNLEATDAKGEHIHQTLMPKKMQRLDESPDFRPFKFRIQAFTNAFHEELEREGVSDEEVSIKKLKQYLWTQPLISRFNEDGKKAKSKGNHIWNIEAKKLPEGGWTFREFSRKIAGAPEKIAYIGLKWSWQPRVWDPQASSSSIKAVFSSPVLPSWLSWEEDEKILSGTPTVESQSGEVKVVAHYCHGGQLHKLEHSFWLQVAPLMAVSTSVPGHDGGQMPDHMARQMAGSSAMINPMAMLPYSAAIPGCPMMQRQESISHEIVQPQAVASVLQAVDPRSILTPPIQGHYVDQNAHLQAAIEQRQQDQAASLLLSLPGGQGQPAPSSQSFAMSAQPMSTATTLAADQLALVNSVQPVVQADFDPSHVPILPSSAPGPGQVPPQPAMVFSDAMMAAAAAAAGGGGGAPPPPTHLEGHDMSSMNMNG